MWVPVLPTYIWISLSPIPPTNHDVDG